MNPPPSPWKKPNEVMQLHKLKKRKKALQDRMSQPSGSTNAESSSQKSLVLDFSRVLEREKRVNPFSKNISQESKKCKLESELQLDESKDKTLFASLNFPIPEKALQNVEDKLSTFSDLLQKYTADHTVEAKPLQNTTKFLPVDWSLKTKVRIMSEKPFPWTTHLKASEEASGITGFVRCVDPEAACLDTSPRGELHQACLYWQHPSLPGASPAWAGASAASPAASTAALLAGCEQLKQAVYTEWCDSFRSLFQLLRARHCPYFYVCGATFTGLFRAAGLAGDPEPSVLLAPTTRGFRRKLRQEDVEFTMPLRPPRDASARDRADDADSCYDSMHDARSNLDPADPADDDDDPGDPRDPDDAGDDPDQFLSQLGLETEVLKKINNAQARLADSAESGVDRAAASLVAARGPDALAVFNVLLNLRPRAAPPTLLAPVAFCGAALRALQVQTSTVRSADGVFHSLQLRGAVLPSALHALCAALRRRHPHTHCLTAAAPPAARALARAAAAVPLHAGVEGAGAAGVEGAAFTASNLSDCGLPESTLRLFCSADPATRALTPSLRYDPLSRTYSW